MSKLQRLGQLSEQEALDLAVELADSLTYDDYLALVKRTLAGDTTLALAVRDIAQAVYDDSRGVAK